MRDKMVSWNNLAADRRVDVFALGVQRICLLVVIVVELLFFLPGEAMDSLVYTFLEWKLVDISILFLAASLCRRRRCAPSQKDRSSFWTTESCVCAPRARIARSSSAAACSVRAKARRSRAWRYRSRP